MSLVHKMNFTGVHCCFGPFHSISKSISSFKFIAWVKYVFMFTLPYLKNSCAEKWMLQ